MPLNVEASWLRVRRLGDARDNDVLDGTEPTPDIGEDIEDDGGPLGEAVAPGETVYFEAQLALSGQPSQNVGVIIKTPPRPNGGFQVSAKSVSGIYKGRSYGADSFNRSVGTIRGGMPGSPLGTNSVLVRGVLYNSNQPGMLQIALGDPESEGCDFITNGLGYSIAGNEWTLFGNDDDAIPISAVNSTFAGSGVSGYIASPFDRFFISQDRLLTWTERAGPDIGGSLDAPVVTADGRIFTASYGGGPAIADIFRSVDAGATWVQVDSVPPNGLIYAMAAHPTNPDVVAYATFNVTAGLRTLYIRVTTNGGSSWTTAAVYTDGDENNNGDIDLSQESPCLAWLDETLLVGFNTTGGDGGFGFHIHGAGSYGLGAWTHRYLADQTTSVSGVDNAFTDDGHAFSGDRHATFQERQQNEGLFALDTTDGVTFTRYELPNPSSSSRFWFAWVNGSLWSFDQADFLYKDLNSTPIQMTSRPSDTVFLATGFAKVIL